ncbi:hypothetical protein ORI89_03195 [Sphingobacterium sp. UT-1RO-CII-1]|uniref:DsrE family protein n=1 Tax=Sphingobacterium sp. UT-1RO-CII-1 TaxID=2995225 RepID=UPI00227C4D5D|nr:hypothetical protein [Sphingobacterium sp. UT-1RO-CII-1]MCY4778643.1 hypothetical protein [Sphingobacterium sp. UT-1RO-CII-1]
MKYSLIFLTLITLSLSTIKANAQDALQRNKTFTGATATAPLYKVIYQMDQGSDEIIKKTIRNINNLLNDPRLKGKVQVELVAFSGGTAAFKKDSGYEEGIRGLVEQGVLVAQCLNTLKERKIEKSELYDFLAYVPTGNGELVIRAGEGWSIVKP